MTDEFKKFSLCVLIVMVMLLGTLGLSAALVDNLNSATAAESEDQAVSEGYWTERLRVVAKPDHDVRILHDSEEDVYYLVIGTSRGLAITPMIDSEGKPISDLHPDADV